MELSDLIPLKFIPNIGSEWIVKSGYLMFKKYELIPIAFINDDIVYVILENKIRNQVIKLVKHLVKINVEFYFTIPEVTDPAGVENLPNKVIKHYLYSYAQREFYDAFNKIEFDIIKNLVDWTSKFGHSDLIKNNYDEILKKINYKSHNWWTNKDVYDYDEIIRQRFNGIYREIQINQLL